MKDSFKLTNKFWIHLIVYHIISWHIPLASYLIVILSWVGGQLFSQHKNYRLMSKSLTRTFHIGLENVCTFCQQWFVFTLHSCCPSNTIPICHVDWYISRNKVKRQRYWEVIFGSIVIYRTAVRLCTILLLILKHAKMNIKNCKVF